eukprot:TRINITY_DN3323_c0_g1_i14.p3 TRINITY_DN3323_c0_g1~~TRINITY_DN3323_c0_g1_i14.p3  ORF type:complete len:119 (+),score=20.13 TRINITY_DN3323_c0_g1_i14:668-1024(+)
MVSIISYLAASTYLKETAYPTAIESNEKAAALLLTYAASYLLVFILGAVLSSAQLCGKFEERLFRFGVPVVSVAVLVGAVLMIDLSIVSSGVIVAQVGRRLDCNCDTLGNQRRFPKPQ